MARLTGIVTFFFSDIEGSTRFWERDAPAMSAALARSQACLRETLTRHGADIFDELPEGFCAAFPSAQGALAAALEIQQALRDVLPVRCALHTARAELFQNGYLSPPLNRLARLLAAGYNGQILLSGATAAQVRDVLPAGVSLRDFGERRLRDLAEPEHVYQVAVPGLPSSFPPLRTLDPRPTNLPAALTSFVGREREVAAVQDLLRRPGARLVTLSGPGGTGKTRLSLAVAAGLRDEFADGVFFVALDTLTDAQRVVPVVARTLGLKEGPGQSLENALPAFLQAREVLLVLDNCEHVVAAAPQLQALSEHAPGVRMLATSRVALHVAGEIDVPVQPLDLPDLAHPAPPEELARYAGVTLFVVRAQAARPDFALNEHSTNAVAELCVRLDGLPLAVELAAARSRLLTPEAMLAQLTQHGALRLLSGGPRDLPARQQTLRAAIEWSYDLLAPREQALFVQLGVFVGGFAVEAVDRVTELPATEGLHALVAQNLVRPAASASDEPRFEMLETIRTYALERLAVSGALAAVRERHAQCYLALAERALPELTGADQAGWLARLEREHDNLRAAHADLCARRDGARALQLAGALWRFWFARGYLSEGGRAIAEALALDDGTGDPAVRARALNGAGILARAQGDSARATTHLSAALDLYRALDDRAGCAAALNSLGILAFDQTDYARAAELYAESLEISRAINYPRGIGVSTGNLGLTYLYQHQPAVARPLFEESLALFRALQDRYGEGVALNNLGFVAEQEGATALARDLYSQSMAIAQAMGNRENIAINLRGLAALAAAAGAPERAARLYGFVDALRETLGAPMRAVDRRAFEEAVAALQAQLGAQAFAVAWETGRRFDLAQALAEALSA
jgi:predicted ATPase/class 3 adenylate cyclase